MITFNTEYSAYFNRRIHNFLETEYIDLRMDDEPYEMLSMFFPDYLIREQKEKCLKVAEELFYWTGDEYNHKMTAFHEFALYNFLSYVQEIQHDMPEFSSIYYDAIDRKEIVELWDNNTTDWEGSITTADGLANFLHDVGIMQELCFDDTDFLMLSRLSNLRDEGDASLETLLGIDFDYYKELLPDDIRERHDNAGQPQPTDLFRDLGDMLIFIAERIDKRGWHKSLWGDNGKPFSERAVQRKLSEYFDLYLKGDKRTDISREADIGSGRIDFKFYANHEEKVVMEIKLGCRDLRRGLQRQLVHYMDALDCTEAYYVVVCYTDADLSAYNKLRGNKLLGAENKTIALCLFDATPKKTASKL